MLIGSSSVLYWTFASLDSEGASLRQSGIFAILVLRSLRYAQQSKHQRSAGALLPQATAGGYAGPACARCYNSRQARWRALMARSTGKTDFRNDRNPPT
jgi:hypothetical protein